MNEMSRPQLMIMYAKTVKRQYNEKQADIQSDWQIASNIMSMLHNTAMGTKKRVKPSDFMPEFRSLGEHLKSDEDSTEDLIEKSEKLGLKTPSKREL